MGAQRDHLRHTGFGIPALDVHGQLLVSGINLTDLDLDLFRRDLADDRSMLAADIAGNGLIEGISRHLQRGGYGHAVHAQHSDIRGAAANIHHHMAIGLLDIQTGTQGRRQGLLDQEHTASPGLNGSIDDAALLYLGNTAGNADDHTGLRGEHRCLGGGFEHLAEHLHGHFVVGDDAVLQWLHSHHVAGGTVQHIPGGGAYLENFARIPVHRHNGGLPDHQALAIGINKDIGCTQVHAQVIGKQLHK